MGKMLLLLAAFAVSGANCVSDTSTKIGSCNPANNHDWVTSGRDCVAISTHGPTARLRKPRYLIVFLHGDVSRRLYAGYMRDATIGLPKGTIGVVMLRPGYAFSNGRTSSGSHHGRRDNYTAANVDIIAGALRELKRHYRGAPLIVVGHSGGAAIAGVILGRYPRLIDQAVLVSCPCDIEAWRRGRRPWTRSLSPSDFVARVPRSTQVYALTGSADANTRPALAEAYVAALRQRGVPAAVTVVPGATHNYNTLSASVSALVRRIAAR